MSTRTMTITIITTPPVSRDSTGRIQDSIFMISVTLTIIITIPFTQIPIIILVPAFIFLSAIPITGATATGGDGQGGTAGTALIHGDTLLPLTTTHITAGVHLPIIIGAVTTDIIRIPTITTITTIAALTR